MKSSRQVRLLFYWRTSVETKLNAQGGAVSLTLPDPKVGITAAEIEAAMDLIITKNIFTGTGGAWISKRDIKVVDTVTDDLYDVPVA